MTARMSYKRPHIGDPELDRKLIAEDYDMLFPRLLEALAQDIVDAKDDQRFNVWPNKLVLIDRERIVAHLREQWDSLNRVRWICAKLRLGREMQDLPLE